MHAYNKAPNRVIDKSKANLICYCNVNMIKNNEPIIFPGHIYLPKCIYATGPSDPYVPKKGCRNPIKLSN